MEKETFFQNAIIKMDSDTFPENFFDIAGWDFLKVFAERQEFCKFSQGWKKATGLFLKFQKYCAEKYKEGDVSSFKSSGGNSSGDKSPENVHQ